MPYCGPLSRVAVLLAAGSGAMRSLWRRLARRWLGGEGSAALDGDTAFLDLLLKGPEEPMAETYRVTRDAGASHRAMISQGLAPEVTAVRARVSPTE